MTKYFSNNTKAIILLLCLTIILGLLYRIGVYTYLGLIKSVEPYLYGCFSESDVMAIEATDLDSKNLEDIIADIKIDFGEEIKLPRIYKQPNRKGISSAGADGKNDCFGVQFWGAVTNFEFSIFSRWGERVFYTKDPKQCWDGRYKGAEQSANVFVYQIRAKGLCGDIYRRGTFVLVR